MTPTKTYASLKAWRKAQKPERPIRYSDATERLGISQREAAAKLGISQPMYSRAEASKPPKVKMAKVISDKTGVPLEILLGVA